MDPLAPMADDTCVEVRLRMDFTGRFKSPPTAGESPVLPAVCPNRGELAELTTPAPAAGVLGPVPLTGDIRAASVDEDEGDCRGCADVRFRRGVTESCSSDAASDADMDTDTDTVRTSRVGLKVTSLGPVAGAAAYIPLPSRPAATVRDEEGRLSVLLLLLGLSDRSEFLGDTLDDTASYRLVDAGVGDMTTLLDERGDRVERSALLMPFEVDAAATAAAVLLEL